MGNKEEFFKTKINDIAAAYKTTASLCSIAVAENDIKLVKKLHKSLNDIFSKLKNIVCLYGDDAITEKIINGDFNGLPEPFEGVKTADYSRKLLALKYTNTNCDNIEDMILINKTAIELNPEEDIPYIKIARTLFESGHPLQALELCKYIKTFSDTVPLLTLSGEIYRSLGMYAESIDAYSGVLKITEDDPETLSIIEQICGEALNNVISSIPQKS